MTNQVDPRELAARALCRKAGNPENTMFEGEPMWKSYLEEVDFVVSAMSSAGTFVPKQPDLASTRARNRMAEMIAEKTIKPPTTTVLMKGSQVGEANPALVAFLKSFEPQIGCPFSGFEVVGANHLKASYSAGTGHYVIEIRTEGAPIPYEK